MNVNPPLVPLDVPHPLQVAAWKNMGATRRAELGAALRRQVRGWKRDALRTQHPEWTEAQVQRELAQIYLRGHT